MISVILPVYNTKQYLQQCLDSLLQQTYRDIEIICVDDGSFDGSESLLDEYGQMDERMRIVHQRNHGESHARNVALQMAKGEYIAFCDCDDWIEPEMYETLIRAIEDDQLDIAAGGWNKEFYEEEDWKTYPVLNEKKVETGVFGRTQLLHYLYERDSYRGFSYMWNKLYTRDCLLEQDGTLMLFDERLRLGGDVVYLAKAALNVKRSKYIDQKFYHYRMRTESGSHTINMVSLRDWIHAYEITISLYEKEGIEQEVVDYLKRFLAYHAYEAAGIALANDQTEDYMYFQKLMQDYQNAYERMNKEHPERIENYRKRIGL